MARINPSSVMNAFLRPGGRTGRLPSLVTSATDGNPVGRGEGPPEIIRTRGPGETTGGNPATPPPPTGGTDPNYGAGRPEGPPRTWGPDDERTSNLIPWDTTTGGASAVTGETDPRRKRAGRPWWVSDDRSLFGALFNNGLTGSSNPARSGGGLLGGNL